MDGWPLTAALLSAALHAAWNAAVKAHPAPREAMAAQMIGAALLAVAGLGITGLPAAAAWPWVTLSTLLNVLAVTALLRAYDSGGFGTVYPVVRALGVFGVAAVAPLLLGEKLGPGAMTGLALVVTALLLLMKRDAGAGDFPASAFAWTAAAGVLTSGYVLADAQGARAGGAAAASGALAYGLAVSVTNALAMAWVMRSAGAPWTLLARHWPLALPAALASTVSYLLILWVYTQAAVAPAAALRDTSAVFAMLIAVLWLKERLAPRRWLALALVLAGVPLLRLG